MSIAWGGGGLNFGQNFSGYLLLWGEAFWKWKLTLIQYVCIASTREAEHNFSTCQLQDNCETCDLCLIEVSLFLPVSLTSPGPVCLVAAGWLESVWGCCPPFFCCVEYYRPIVYVVILQCRPIGRCNVYREVVVVQFLCMMHLSNLWTCATSSGVGL